MTRLLVIFLANLAVVIALSANAVVTLATGCSIGGTCSASPSAMTWALAVGPSLLLAIGTLWMWRGAKSGAIVINATAESDLSEAPTTTAKPAKQSSAQVNAEAAIVEDAARNRLSRVVASNSRPAFEPEVEAAEVDTPDEMPELASVAGTDPVEEPFGEDEAPDVTAVDSFDSEPEPVMAEAELPTAPHIVEPAPPVHPARQPLDWMWLVDPAQPHHIAANAATGFPWIAGTIDLFASTLIDDPHFADDAEVQAEAAAWLEITATLPADMPIEPADGQAFIDWVNSHVGDKGHLLTPLLDETMAILRAEALCDPELAVKLPTVFGQDDDESSFPIAMIG